MLGIARCSEEELSSSSTVVSSSSLAESGELAPTVMTQLTPRAEPHRSSSVPDSENPHFFVANVEWADGAGPYSDSDDDEVATLFSAGCAVSVMWWFVCGVCVCCLLALVVDFFVVVDDDGDQQKCRGITPPQSTEGTAICLGSVQRGKGRGWEERVRICKN